MPIVRFDGIGLDGNDSDNEIPVDGDVGLVASFNYGYDAVGDDWDRLRSGGNNADDIAVSTLGNLNCNNFLHAFDGTNWDRVRLQVPNIDALSASPVVGSLRVLAQEYIFNGVSFDRKRNNTEETILASAARTASVNSADFTNFNAKGAQFIVDVSADPAAASLIVTIQGKDPISGNYYDLLVSAAINSIGTTVLKIFPGIAAIANASASDILPRTFRVKVVTVDADELTYSISSNLVV